MILEEATHEAFGYYARDLKHKSNKPIIATCDECGKVRITSKNAYCELCLSCCRLDVKNHNYGKHLSAKTRGRISKAHIGKVRSDASRTRQSEAMKGTKNHFLGKHHTRKAREKIGAAERYNTYCVGRAMSKETRAKIGEAHKGNKCYFWKGGISFEPYCVKFNRVFKEYIRFKFNNKCFLCSMTTEENGQLLSVHHVNYNKNCGCDGDKTCNFVPLCRSCHSKTNYNRDYWQKLIADKLHNMII
jgi:hypothetical protein